MTSFTDKQRLDFIEEWAKKSRTGVSVDWAEEGYRFMSFHNLGDFRQSARSAIDAAMLARGLTAAVVSAATERSDG